MPKKQIERFWLLGVALVAFVLILIGYTMFVSPQNAKTSTARSQVSTAEASNQRLQARIDGLRAESKNLAKYQADLVSAQLALPSTSGLPDFLRTLQSIGNATLSTMSALSVGTPTDVTPIAGAAAQSSTSSSGSSATASTVGGVRVYELPINATVNGSTSALEAFLTQLQTVQPRAVLISSLTEAAGTVASGAGAGSSNPNQTSLTLTMQAFVAPSSAAEKASLSTASGK